MGGRPAPWRIDDHPRLNIFSLRAVQAPITRLSAPGNHVFVEHVFYYIYMQNYGVRYSHLMSRWLGLSWRGEAAEWKGADVPPRPNTLWLDEHASGPKRSGMKYKSMYALGLSPGASNNEDGKTFLKWVGSCSRLLCEAQLAFCITIQGPTAVLRPGITLSERYGTWISFLHIRYDLPNSLPGLPFC
jgi:hypothetical protein